MHSIPNTCTSRIFKRVIAFAIFLVGHSALPAQEIPKKFKKSDQNKNGIIEIHEVNTAIDYLFIGSKGYTTDYIHGLIDLYFEQKKGS